METLPLDSPVYMVFLIMVVVTYWQLRQRGQNLLLLIASYCFYAWWDYRFLLLMSASTFVDYWMARRIGSSVNPVHRKLLLVISLTLNFSLLGYFKYFDFFLGSCAGGAALLGMHGIPHSLWKVILPPAISFYTFQEVAYIVDVYRGNLAPADSLLEYALFISFFPHLIAGPIQRPGHLLPQVQMPRSFDQQRIYDGCMLIVSGLFRKCVVADSCAQLANAVFDGKMGHTGWATLLGTYAFAFQIYGDFSGYSDIARGSAQLLGFHFMVNFRQPYLATSLQEFWKRWHISLSSWLRDYLYIPMGGSRRGVLRTYRNLLLTMLLGGLWHGASWNFVAWGAIHGSVLAIERKTGTVAANSLAARRIARAVTFNIVCVAWIFFRAPSLHSSLLMFAALKDWRWAPSYGPGFVYLLAFSLPLLLIDCYMEHSSEEYPAQRSPLALQLTAAAMAVVTIAFAASYQSSPFVYFQF